MIDWRLATLLGVALVVLCGFAWYERSRPSSRVVALVAALAALAVAGRLVLTPLPNVVATTDIAFLTGFALGGPPGFAVGALAAPISNIWLGQGPWTVWQMAGWGAAGLAGAGMAVALGRNLGRFWLASACALVGLAYGALLDLSVMVTYGGEQSLDRYLALSARGIPFNVAHAAGNFAIALVAGPALVRMISRYRERLEFTWHPAGALPALVAALAVSLTLVAPPPVRADAGEARSYLTRQQNSDGGFAATPNQPSSPAMTTWSMLGLESAGVNPRDVRSGGRSPIDYLRSTASRIRSATDLERTILALEAAGLDSRSFAGRDLVSELRAKRGGDGSWDGQVNITAFGILALRAAGQGDVGSSAAWLRDAQDGNGGWGFRPGAASDADSTGAAIQALAAAGGSAGSLTDGTEYLRKSQRPDGGWSLAGGTTNSQSTAWALQGLVAAGGASGAVREGIAHLAARQQGDGHYRYSSGSDQTPIWVTAQALLGVTRSPFPLAEVPRGSRIRTGGKGHGPGGPGSRRASGTGAGPTGAGASGDGRDKDGPRKDTDGKGHRKQEESSERSGKSVPELLPAANDSVDGRPAAGTADDGGGMHDGAKVGAGLGGLALALAGGFLWYRRTLP